VSVASPFHATALVESTDLGAGTRVWAYAHIMAGATIGRNCNIGDHCFVESGVVIGDSCTIKNGTLLWKGVTLEAGVFVGPNVVFTNDKHPRSPRLELASARYADESNWLLPTLVRRGASIAAGAVVLPGIEIGEFAMVAAGAVVTRSVDAYALVAGNPARPIGHVCRCGKPLVFADAIGACASCGARYRLDGQHVSAEPRSE
jgi:UDP-2-acetamido-3-amino-2,3-dideoxy-glucuronate N-acetyltransferase